MKFKVVKKGVKKAQDVKGWQCCLEIPANFLRSPER